MTMEEIIDMARILDYALNDLRETIDGRYHAAFRNHATICGTGDGDTPAEAMTAALAAAGLKL